MQASRGELSSATLLRRPAIALLILTTALAEAVEIRVATFNVLSSNQRYADTLAWTGRTSPDLIFFPETNAAWATALTA